MGRCVGVENIKYKTLIAMGCITFLEALALYLGVDGAILSLSIGALAGLGGYELAKAAEEEDKSHSEG